MQYARIVAVAGSLAVMALSAACSEEDIVLARVPPSPRGGSPLDGKRCVESSECQEQDFCARSVCDDVAGACEQRPVFCEEDAQPVCGCDGITYFNDCLRRAAGVTAMTKGECRSNAVPCGGKLPPPPGPGPGAGPPDPRNGCPSATFCARLLPPSRPGGPPGDSCAPDVPGTCWAIPAVCPASGGSDRWVECGPTVLSCRTTCDAIRSGIPHRRAVACP